MSHEKNKKLNKNTQINLTNIQTFPIAHIQTNSRGNKSYWI